MEQQQEQAAAAASTWRQRCIQQFQLQELPESASPYSKRLSESSSEETWKRYHQFRSEQEQNGEAMQEEYGDDDVEEAERNLNQSVQELAATIGGRGDWWCRHMKLRVTEALDNGWDELRSMKVATTLFSPLAIPHAVQLLHRNHHRTRHSSVEFYCTWWFRLVRFDGKGLACKDLRDQGVTHGDGRTKRLATLWPDGFISIGNDDQTSEPLYYGEEGMEVLCDNCLKKPPSVPFLPDGELWQAVENIDVRNFTASTIFRIRNWLFGQQQQQLTDFDFVRLLFASYGTSEFELYERCRGDVGYYWDPYKSGNSSMGAVLDEDGEYHERYIRAHVNDPPSNNEEEMKGTTEEEEDEEDADSLPGVSWLEYQARLVTGALRPIDRFYQPYDEMEQRAEWGSRVLLAGAEENEEEAERYLLEEGEESLEDLCEISWIVWDRLRKRSGMGGIGGEGAAMLLQALMQQQQQPRPFAF